MVASVIRTILRVYKVVLLLLLLLLLVIVIIILITVFLVHRIVSESYAICGATAAVIRVRIDN